MAWEVSRAASRSHLLQQLPAVTLGLSLKPLPLLHLKKKKRHDGARIPAGIPVRIREIRDKHQALLIPSKSAVKDGWTQLEVFGLQQSGIGCQLQDVTRGVTNSQPLMRDLPDRPASGSEMLQGLEESRLKYKCDNCVTCGDNGAAVASHELARVVCQFPRGRRAPSD